VDGFHPGPSADNRSFSTPSAELLLEIRPSAVKESADGEVIFSLNFLSADGHPRDQAFHPPRLKTADGAIRRLFYGGGRHPPVKNGRIDSIRRMAPSGANLS
jgi:hypothetical protein